MFFDQPYLLVLLAAVPVLAWLYVWSLRRRRSRAVRHPHVALLRTAVGPRRTWRRHVPIALLLAALGLLGLAAGRPQVRTDVPTSNSTVILALDISGSMCATDIPPNRLTAAQAAIRAFVEEQEGSARIGLVLFSGFAQLAVAPTTEHEDVLDAIDAVVTGRGTTIGAAILTAIDAIAEIDARVAPSDQVEPDDAGGFDPGAGRPSAPAPTPSPGTSDRLAGDAPTVPPVPEIIVLLTDGANTRGVTPEAAAEQAAARGVRIYPIGFGTRTPTSMVCSRDQYGGFEPRWMGRVAGGTVRSGRGYLLVDEPALRAVAEITGGTYFAASDAEGLSKVLAELPRHVTVQQQDVDLSAGFAAFAAVCLVAGVGLTLRWSTLT